MFAIHLNNLNIISTANFTILFLGIHIAEFFISLINIQKTNKFHFLKGIFLQLSLNVFVNSFFFTNLSGLASFKFGTMC